MTEYIVLIIVAAVVFSICLGSVWYTRKGKRSLRLGEVFGIFVIFVCLVLFFTNYGIFPEYFLPVLVGFLIYLTIKAVRDIYIYRHAPDNNNLAESRTRNNST